MRNLIVLLFLFTVPVQAGRYCGADGHFLSPLVPESFGRAKFSKACQRHDDCYATCGVERLDCDREFHSNLRQSCRDAYFHPFREPCYRVVAGYYSAVYRNGREPFEEAQEPCALW